MAGIAGRVPGAVYNELPGTPHMQTLERPELVAAALNEFLPAASPGYGGNVTQQQDVQLGEGETPGAR